MEIAWNFLERKQNFFVVNFSSYFWYPDVHDPSSDYTTKLSCIILLLLLIWFLIGWFRFF